MTDAKFSAMDDSVTIIDEMIGLTVPVSGSYLDEVKDNVQRNVNYIKSFLSTSTNTSGDTDVTGDSREAITSVTTATLNGAVTTSTSLTISAANGAILKGHILTCTGYTSEYADTNINVAAVSGTTITLNSAVTISNGVTLTFKSNKYYKAVNEGTYFVSSGTFNSTTGELTSTSSVISSTLSVGGTSKLTGALTTVAGITNTGGEILVSGGNVQLNDSILLTLGTDDDISLYHNGTDGYITNSTGALKLATETSGIAVTIGHSTSEVTIGDNMTVSGDATVTGDLTVSGGKVTLTNGSIIDSETAGTLKLTEDLVECSGDLQVTGNHIKESGGTTAITMSGANLTFAGTVTLSADPSADLQAATKQYVDSVAAGLDPKESVLCATVSAMTIGSGATEWAYSSGTLTYGSNGASSDHSSLFDGVTLASADRVLVKNASNTDANGIYTCITVGVSESSATVLTRATDHNTTGATGNISAGNFVFIEGGSTLADTGFVMQKNTGWTNTNWPDALTGNDTAANKMTWTQFSSSGSSSSAADDITTGDDAVLINTSSGAIGIGTNTTASNNINIGTGAVARTITMGNVTGATTLALNSGTGGIALTSTGAGDITINSDDTLLIDADGVLELNSSAGAIGIGNDAVAQAINIGTGAAARTITIGNDTGASGLVLTTGSGNATVNTPSLDIKNGSTSGATIALYEDSDNGSNYVALKAPSTIASNVTWTLPNADGTANYVLATDGSGALSWAENSSGGSGASSIHELTDGSFSGALVTSTDALLAGITTDTSAITTGTQTGLATSTNGNGSGAILTIVASGTTVVTGVTVTTAGSGYAAGDTLTVAASEIAGSSSDLVFTLDSGDVQHSGTIILGHTDPGSSVTSINNVGLGEKVLYSLTTGVSNIGVGTNSLKAITSGRDNIALGESSNYVSTTGDQNISIGTRTLYANTGSDNCSLGHNSLYSNTAGSRNIGIGSKSLYSNTTTSNNTSIGYESLYLNAGANNTSIGYQSGYGKSGTTITGTNNISIGYRSMYELSSGGENAGIGYLSLFNNTSGGQNVAIGNRAGFKNTSGSRNVFIGHRAGYSETATSNDKLYISSYSTSDSAGLLTDTDSLLGSITTNVTDATNGTLTGIATTGGNNAAELTLVISGNTVTSVTVTTTGAGFSAGDTLTVAKANIPGSGSESKASVDLVFTLVSGDIVNSERNLLKGDFSSGALELGQTSNGTVTVLNNLNVTNDIELGHSSDTTLSRNSAGVLAVEGKIINTKSQVVAAQSALSNGTTVPITKDANGVINIDTTHAILTTGAANYQVYLPAPATVGIGHTLTIINHTSYAAEVISAGSGTAATTMNGVATTASNANTTNEKEVAIAATSIYMAAVTAANTWSVFKVGTAVAPAAAD